MDILINILLVIGWFVMGWFAVRINILENERTQKIYEYNGSAVGIWTPFIFLSGAAGWALQMFMAIRPRVRRDAHFIPSIDIVPFRPSEELVRSWFGFKN